MIKEFITPQDAVDLLNEMLRLDPAAATALLNARVPCNQDVANHPTIQVRGYGSGNPSVGLLGVLNGMFGTDDGGAGPIGAVYDDEKQQQAYLQRFEVRT
jgi:hypothetical protein